MKKWYDLESETYHGVVISSRVRLARNLVNHPFPNRLDDEGANQVINMTKNAIETTKETLTSFFEHVAMNRINQVDKIAMMEKHIISPQFVKVKMPASLILSKDEALSIMINEEDHIRIQSMACGMNLEKALKEANHIDDLFEEALDYAFDDKFGYLTACPTNLGTGLRASYMIHVPALETTGQLQFILEAIGKFGLTVRGIYGEGTEAQGSVFQISNQVTLGQTEYEIIDNLTSVTKQIIEQELIVRHKLLKDKRKFFEDAVYRSYGVLSHARMITSKEAMRLLSDLKVGIELGVIETVDNRSINIYNLMAKIQPANLQIIYNRDLDLNERDSARADYIRDHLPQLIGG
ncbi:MAG: protein arginine kinase [Firmicutes bacterium HGW-Firmicutes-5]|nr:MAG: protein arginine kinase [Firmicutes bacterium HGW-Firmicutes-5]